MADRLKVGDLVCHDVSWGPKRPSEVGVVIYAKPTGYEFINVHWIISTDSHPNPVISGYTERNLVKLSESLDKSQSSKYPKSLRSKTKKTSI